MRSRRKETAQSPDLSRLGAALGVCYTQPVLRRRVAVKNKKKDGYSHRMRTTDFFWKLFTSTGSISAYLLYRQLHGIS